MRRVLEWVHCTRISARYICRSSLELSEAGCSLVCLAIAHQGRNMDFLLREVGPVSSLFHVTPCEDDTFLNIEQARLLHRRTQGRAGP